MSSRDKLVIFCGTSTVFFLLLVVIEMRRSLNASMRDYNNLDDSSTDIPLGVNITEVLANQRYKIAREIENTEYLSCNNIAKLTNLTEVTTVHSIVITTWLTGSNYLGHILNALPGNFYHYEPLLNFGNTQLQSNGTGAALAIQNLKNLLNCDYNNMSSYINYRRANKYLLRQNERLWTACQKFPYFCTNAKTLTAFCKLFPLQSMKIVRSNLSLAQHLLKDGNLNVRILLLVRDPRGTIEKRKHRDCHADFPNCHNAKYLCQQLVAEYHTARELLTKYPARLKIVRYEDLTVNPYEMTYDILQFFGLPFTLRVVKFLDSHTVVNSDGVSLVYHESSSAPFYWLKGLESEDIQIIQNKCTKAMELWGYRKVVNFYNFRKTFDPLILPPPFA